MYIQNLWLKSKKYTITRIEMSESAYDRIMQTYWGKLSDKPGKEIKLVIIEYHKPIFDRRPQ